MFKKTEHQNVFINIDDAIVKYKPTLDEYIIETKDNQLENALLFCYKPKILNYYKRDLKGKFEGFIGYYVQKIQLNKELIPYLSASIKNKKQPEEIVSHIRKYKYDFILEAYDDDIINSNLDTNLLRKYYLYKTELPKTAPCKTVQECILQMNQKITDCEINKVISVPIIVNDSIQVYNAY